MAITAAAIGAGAGILSNIFGSSQAQQQAQQATQDQQEAVQQWLSLNVPDPAQQAVELQNYQVTGQLSPQLEQAFQQSQTNLNNIQLTGPGRAAEVQALGQMQQLAQNGGLDAQAEQQIQQAINQTNANTQGQVGAIVQNAAARGMGAGSGAMLAAELEAAQGGANSAAQAGSNAAAAAQQRALQAMQNESVAGNTLNASDYGQAAAAAQAADQIQRFNVQNSQNVANQNTSAVNSAQAANLANAQSVSNANVSNSNQATLYNSGLTQQDYEDQLQKDQGLTGALTGAAKQSNTNATNTGNMWSGIGKAASAGAGAIAQAYNNKSGGNSDNLDDLSYPSDSNSSSSSNSSSGSGSSSYARGGKVEPESDWDKLVALARSMNRKKAA